MAIRINPPLDQSMCVGSQVPFLMRSISIDPRSDDAELDDRFWPIGDKRTDWNTGMVVEMGYRCPDWIEGEVARVLHSEEESPGDSTRLSESVRSSMDPSRKIEFLILARRGSWTCQVFWRRLRVCSCVYFRRLAQWNYPTKVDCEHSDHRARSLFRRALSTECGAPGTRFSKSVSREDPEHRMEPSTEGTICR